MGWYGTDDAGRRFYESDAFTDKTMTAGNATGVARAMYRYYDVSTTQVRLYIYYDFQVTANSFQGSYMSFEYAPHCKHNSVETFKYAYYNVYTGGYGPFSGGGSYYNIMTDCGLWDRGTNFLMHMNVWYTGGSGTKYQSYCSHEVTIPTITQRASLTTQNGMVIYPTANNPRLVKKVYVYK